MAKAKKIIRKTEKEARKELRKSGALKGLSRKEKKRKIAVAGLGKRKQIRQFTADEKRLRQEQFQKDMDARRAEAKAKGVVPIYDQPKSKGKFQGSPEEIMQKSGDGAPTRRLREGDSVTFDPKTGLYKIKSGDYVSYSKTKPAAYGAKIKKAKHGGALAIMIAPVKSKKMKAIKKGAHGAKVKKAPGGASMKKMSMYKDGGSLKPVPSEAKGLSKLPKSVRNKMGYAKHGGSMKKAMYGAKMKKKAMYGAKMKK
jgi:hypothetical protein